jgi:hypothetical protein
MRALCLNCTLKLSPEPSNPADLARHVLDELRAAGLEQTVEQHPAPA